MPLLRMVAFPALVVLLVLGGCANLILGMQVKLCALQAIPVDFLSATYIAADDIEFPAREVPGLAAMLLAVRDVNLRNCAIVKGCDSLLLSRPGACNDCCCYPCSRFSPMHCHHPRGWKSIEMEIIKS